MVYRFSPSSLNLLKECPRCFWLQFNKGVKRPTGIFPSLPSGMDRVLKKYFDEFVGTKKLPRELGELNGFELFSEKKLLEKWRNNFQGIEWKDEEGNRLRGAVDCILKRKNKLVVLDYKTRGYPLKEDTPKYYQNQLDFYNFLLQKNGFDTEDFSFLLFYHPLRVNKDGNFTFFSSLIKMSVSVKNAENIFKNALTTLKGPCPKNNECTWCKKH